MNKKGFLLIDSLVNIAIVSCIGMLVVMTFNSMINYEKGYLQYQELSNEKLINIFNSLGTCEACLIDESY